MDHVIKEEMCTWQNVYLAKKGVPDRFGAHHEWKGFHSWKRALVWDWWIFEPRPGDESAFVSYLYEWCGSSLVSWWWSGEDDSLPLGFVRPTLLRPRWKVLLKNRSIWKVCWFSINMMTCNCWLWTTRIENGWQACLIHNQSMRSLHLLVDMVTV